MPPSTIGGINNLPEAEKRAIYARYIPGPLLERFNLPERISAHPEFPGIPFTPGSKMRCARSTNCA
jgi:hypothetical protein